MRDVYGILSEGTKANEKLNEQLNQFSRQRMGKALLKDLEWRCQHLGLNSDFWNTVFDRVPYHLTQMSTQESATGPKDIINPNNAGHIYQTLWSHPAYKAAQLTRSMVLCYHRHDGRSRPRGGGRIDGGSFACWG